QIRRRSHSRRWCRGQRRRRLRSRRLRSQRPSLALVKFLPLLPQLPHSGGNQGDQREIQQPQFALQNRDPPFCSGTSLRGITPDSVRRTVTVLFFGLAALMRISLEASRAFCEVSAASMLTNWSMPHSKDTATDTSP